MNGFLGTRGDFFSDLLVTGLAGIIPALIAATFFAAKKRFALHRAAMIAIFSVLTLYSVIYGANLFLGDRFISEDPFFIFLLVHLAITALTVLFGGLTLAKKGIDPVDRHLPSCRHRIVFAEMGLLAISVFTGFFIYYLTFIY